MAMFGVPNKPVLPTATTALNHYPPGSLRRQTGQPLGPIGTAVPHPPLSTRITQALHAPDPRAGALFLM